MALSQSSASRGFTDPLKVGGLVLRNSISFSFMLMARGLGRLMALKIASIRTVWLAKT
jgi:hypothetical protein